MTTLVQFQTAGSPLSATVTMPGGAVTWLTVPPATQMAVQMPTTTGATTIMLSEASPTDPAGTTTDPQPKASTGYPAGPVDA